MGRHARGTKVRREIRLFCAGAIAALRGSCAGGLWRPEAEARSFHRVAEKAIRFVGQIIARQRIDGYPELIEADRIEDLPSLPRDPRYNRAIEPSNGAIETRMLHLATALAIGPAAGATKKGPREVGY